jgi:hypothetical protein
VRAPWVRARLAKHRDIIHGWMVAPVVLASPQVGGRKRSKPPSLVQGDFDSRPGFSGVGFLFWGGASAVARG